MDRDLTARTLVDDLGTTVLRLAIEGTDPDRPLTGVAIHDRWRTGQHEPGTVVLGVGVQGTAELRDFATAMVAAGAHALAVKGPLPTDFTACPLPVIEVSPGAEWLHLATIIQGRLLARARARVRPDDGSDLFGLANTISALLDAPVTIEDRSSAVLAWSSGQAGTDAARVETILGRAVHRRWLDELDTRGVFTALHSSPDPVFIEPIGPGLLPRVAIAVRAGSDVLGYVWAVVTEPLSAERSGELRNMMPLVALHLVNAHADSTRAQRRRDLAAAVLGGGPAMLDAARELHLGPGPLCVLAAGRRDPRPPGEDADSAIGLRRFGDALDRHLAAVHSSAVTVIGDRAVYAVLSWRDSPEEAVESSATMAKDFLRRLPDGQDHVIAVGGPACTINEVPTVRKQADAILRALRSDSHAPTISTFEDLALPVMLLGLADVCDDLGLPPVTGPLRRLLDNDRPQTILRPSLVAYFAAAGVTETAAAELKIHVNTMRYRLRRIREVSRLDFSDADAMLLAHLQLRIDKLRETSLAQNTKRNPNLERMPQDNG